MWGLLCGSLLAGEATRGSLYWRPSGRRLGRDRTRSMTRTCGSGLWAWYPPSPLAFPTPNESITAFDDRMRKKLREGQEYYDQGVVLFNSGEFPLAIKAFKSSLKKFNQAKVPFSIESIHY